VPGSVVAAVVAGRRPMLVEVQALVGDSSASNPRRGAQGVDGGRLALLLAVLERRVGIRGLGGYDVHALAVGGVRLDDPGADLAVAVAIVSSLHNRPVPERLAVFGEVGLTGELRGVGRATERVGEAQRLGFDPVMGPSDPAERVSTLYDALSLADLL